MILFPALVKSLPRECDSEKAVFLSFGFLNRAVRLPDDEYAKVEEEMITDAVNILNTHYEKAYGATACSYNFHIVGSHLPEIREQGGPMTEYSAYPFEGLYAEMRACFSPGTRKFDMFGILF